MAGDAMDAGAMPCAAQVADCINLDDINHDPRDGQTKVSDPPTATWAAVWPAEPLLLAGAVRAARTRVGDPRCRAGAYPPLNVLFCVYLD